MDSYCPHCGQKIDTTNGQCYCVGATNERLSYNFNDSWPSTKDNHIRVTLDFVPVSERLPDDDMCDRRVIVFSPCYPAGDPMRERIISAQFIKTTTDVTHWAEIPTIRNQNCE